MDIIEHLRFNKRAFSGEKWLFKDGISIES